MQRRNRAFAVWNSRHVLGALTALCMPYRMQKRTHISCLVDVGSKKSNLLIPLHHSQANTPNLRELLSIKVKSVVASNFYFFPCLWNDETDKNFLSIWLKDSETGTHHPSIVILYSLMNTHVTIACNTKLTKDKLLFL